MNLLKPNNQTSSGQFKSMLIYGETQSGKTSLLGTLARAHHARTGKITRLIMTDEGGTSAIDPEIQDGIIQVVSLVADDKPQSNLMWLAKGHFLNATGVIDQSKPNLDNVGIVALDSLSSAAALVMNWFVQSGLKVGQDVVALRTEQNLNFGNPAMAHYGAVHQFILQLTTALNGLPVEKVIYTALESKGVDSTDGQIILGPAIVGKALTGVIPSRMNRILHLEIVPNADKSDRSYRIYFQPHVDKTLGRVWPANLRMPLKLRDGRQFKEAIQSVPAYAKGFLDFKTGDELLELFDFCEGLVKVVETPTAEPVVISDPKTPIVGTVAVGSVSKATDAERVRQLLKK